MWNILTVFFLLGQPIYGLRKSNCNQTVSSSSVIISHRDVDIPYGQELFCVVEISAPQDTVIQIKFIQFQIGELREENGRCAKGYFSIRETSRNYRPGYYCGELDQIYSYYAETNKIKTFIYAEEFNEYVDYEFEIIFIPKPDLPERFGLVPFHDESSEHRGTLIEGSFCQRTFSDCSRMTKECFVQSPGYPGVYPKSLNCRYFINSAEPLIRLYVDGFSAKTQSAPTFDVDGRNCDSLITCPFKPLTNKASACHRDYISIYDGDNEFSELIGTFCGIGDFPSAVIGRGRSLFVQFVTSESGPFINTGFDFRVDHIPAGKLDYRGDYCHRVYSSEDLEEANQNEGIFLPLEHWYAPNTNCSVLILGKPYQIVRLTFPSFRVNSILNPIDPLVNGDCRESLTIYDSTWSNGSAVIKTFCDDISSPPSNKKDFVSKSNALFINFLSQTGSYSGSSFQFWGQYDFFDGRDKVQPGTLCDRLFQDQDNNEEFNVFQSPRNTLIYKQKWNPSHSESEQPVITCNYDLVAAKHQRILLELTSLSFKSKCRSDSKGSYTDRIEIYDEDRTISECLDSCSEPRRLPIKYVSSGPEIRLIYAVDAETAVLKYFKSGGPIFTAQYRFVHPPSCGISPRIPMRNSGSMTFPYKPLGPIGGSLTCIWDLEVRPRSDLHMRLTNATFYPPSENICENGYVEIEFLGERLIRLCDGAKTLPSIKGSKILGNNNFLRISYYKAHDNISGYFNFQWSSTNSKSQF